MDHRVDEKNQDRKLLIVMSHYEQVHVLTKIACVYAFTSSCGLFHVNLPMMFDELSLGLVNKFYYSSVIHLLA